MSFNEDLSIEIGEGIFGWDKKEADMERFGSVSLFKGLQGPDRVIFPRYKGMYQLATITIEVRKTRYMSARMFGKRFLIQRPGNKTLLSTGELFYPDPFSIGTKPLIILNNGHWMNYETLVSLSDQTVKLFLIPVITK